MRDHTGPTLVDFASGATIYPLSIFPHVQIKRRHHYTFPYRSRTSLADPLQRLYPGDTCSADCCRTRHRRCLHRRSVAPLACSTAGSIRRCRSKSGRLRSERAGTTTAHRTYNPGRRSRCKRTRRRREAIGPATSGSAAWSVVLWAAGRVAPCSFVLRPRSHRSPLATTWRQELSRKRHSPQYISNGLAATWFRFIEDHISMW